MKSRQSFLLRGKTMQVCSFNHATHPLQYIFDLRVDAIYFKYMLCFAFLTLFFLLFVRVLCIITI